MDQHYRLGAAYRSWLIDHLHFLSPIIDPSVLFVRATSVERTIKSAISFLHGLYEPQSFDEELEITTGTDTFDPIRIHENFCAELKDVLMNYSNSQNWLRYIQTAGAMLLPVRKYLGEDAWDFEAVDRVCDWVITMHANERAMPRLVNRTHVDLCFEINAKRQFGPYLVSPRTAAVGFSYGMREMLNILDRFTGNVTKHRFVLLSAHDSTIAACLAMLRQTRVAIPPFASHLAMQVLESERGRLFVRFVFNGEVLALPAFEKRQIVELDSFTSTMRETIRGICV
jgi:acid phosphatase